MYGDITITKREIIASISIIAIMLLFGFMISGKISEKVLDRNEIYNKAVKIESTDMFEYGMRTNVGNAFVYGDLEAVDTVTYPEIGGEYMYVEKVEEHREKHERTVTKTDSDGNTYTETETYYSWDTENIESQSAKEIKFCNVTFPFSKIDLPYAGHIKTISGDRVWSWKSGEYVKVRFVYYGIGTKFTGTIFTDLRDNTIPDDTEFHKDMNLEETVEMKTSSGIGAQIGFWIAWIGLICLCVFGFYYIDNRWLE